MATAGFPFPSAEWVSALGEQLNASEAYERSAKDWEGDYIFVVQPDEFYSETTYLYLDLYHGKSRAVARLTSPDERQAAYRISAPYSTWRKVVEGKLDPIQGMMMRQLKLEGDMMKVMRYPKAAREIIACCAKVPTQF